MAKIYEKENNLKEFSRSLKSYITYKDSNARINRAQELLAQQLEFDYQRKHLADSTRFGQKERLKNVELQLSATKLKQEKMYRTLLLSMAALILILAIFIFNRLVLTRKQKTIIETQKQIVETRNKEFVDSINYAKRLQAAILPQINQIKEKLNTEVLYLPKDVIGGDFYFFEQYNDYTFFTVCDCTGHGIRGALMSVVCHQALTKAIKEFDLSDPAQILTRTREIIVVSLNAKQQNIKDGMDFSLCVFNKTTGEIKWAGANNSLWIIRDKTITELKDVKQPVALYEHPREFISHSLPDVTGSILVLSTDDFSDQFGGPNGKKFKAKALKNFLLTLAGHPVKAQKEQLHDKFVSWKG